MNLSVEPVAKNPERWLLWRFLGATLVPTILLCLSISFGMLSIHKQYLFTQKEIVGTHAVHHLFMALTNLQKIRGLSRMLYWSDTPDLAVRRQESMVEFKNQFITPQWEKLSAQLGVEKEGATILLEVHDLYNAKNSTLSEEELYARYTVIIEKIHTLILIVADRSNLVLDPDFETYSLMELSVKQIPDLCEAFATIRGLGSSMLAKGYSTEEEGMLFQKKLAISQDQIRKFERTKSTLNTTNPETKFSLTDKHRNLDHIAASFLQASSSLRKEQSSLSAEGFFRQGTAVINTFAEIFHSTVDRMGILLRQRLSDLRRLLLLTVIISALTIAAIFYFALSFYRLQQNASRELARISITDPLTSLPNRRYLTMIFDREIHRARRDGKGLAFGILDIDFFKRFNDTYGHHEGDLALQKVAGALKTALQRAGDFYFRFGGEEFCFMCNATTLTEAEETGERIRAAVEQLAIEHRENSASPVVTISLGVAFLPEATTENLDYMIKHADNLLYEAKDNGRNQCIAVALTPRIPHDH